MGGRASVFPRSEMHPRCVGCQLEMTPENSKLRPELFYCDACLPDGFKPTPPAVARSVSFMGLRLAVSGAEIIAHAKTRQAEYLARWEEYAAAIKEAEALKNRHKRGEITYDEWYKQANLLDTYYVTYGGRDAEGMAKFFNFVAEHVTPTATYHLGVEDLRALQMFEGG